MPPITVTPPAVGIPTRTDGFAQPVIEALDYLNSVASLESSTPDVPNGSFEIGSEANTAPAGWVLETLAAGNATEFETNQAYTRHGRKSFKMTTPSGITGGVVLVSEDFQKCAEGISFVLTWQILASVAGTSNAVKIRWYDGSESLLGTSTLWSDTATNPTSWTQKDETATPPTGAKLFKIVLEGVNNSVAASVYWDGLSLKLGGGHTLSVITSSGSYIPKTKEIKVKLWGGGGGGGGGASGNNGFDYGADGSPGGTTSFGPVSAGGGDNGNAGGRLGSQGDDGESRYFSAGSIGTTGAYFSTGNGVLSDVRGALSNSGPAQGGFRGGGNYGGGNGGHGAAGQYVEAILKVVPGVPITVTIGAGGAGGGSNGGDGASGGSPGTNGLCILEEIG